jgi:hypothetical protein
MKLACSVKELVSALASLALVVEDLPDDTDAMAAMFYDCGIRYSQPDAKQCPLAQWFALQVAPPEGATIEILKDVAMLRSGNFEVAFQLPESAV